jgi:hypothetical protein
MERAGPLRRVFVSATVAGLLACSIALAFTTSRHASLTADEPKHIATALFHASEGRCCLGRDNSPSLVLNAVPLLFGEHPGRSSLVPGSDPWRSGRELLLAEPDLEQTTRRARLASLALLLALGVTVFAWARSLYGPSGGLLALFLFSFSPTLLAHGSLATSDIHAACFITLAAFTYARFLDRPRVGRLLASGLALGLALAAKFSALALLPSFALLGLVAGPWGEERLRGRLGRHGASLAAILLVAACVLFAAYGASSARVPLSGGEASLAGFADYLDGLARVRVLGERGWNSYLLGEYRLGGWWYYYPIALAVKTPIPALLAFVAAFATTPWIVGVERRREACVWIPALVLLAAALASDLNIGVRHLLPVLPLLYVVCGRLVTLELGPASVRRLLLTAGGAWYVLGTVSHHPHHLSYFNELAGGPERGHLVIADSNLDWGQSLRDLKHYLDAEGVEAVRLAYFGPTPPGRYGIRYQPLPSFDRHPEDSVHRGSFGERELLVVSAYDLLGIDPSMRRTYAWLRERDPIARPGYSFFVYDVTDDLEAQRRLVQMYQEDGDTDLASLERARLRARLAARREAREGTSDDAP